MKEKTEAREALAYFMRRLYERGMTSSTGGNASILAGGVIIITPSGADKGSLDPSDMVELSIEGVPLREGDVPSMESGLHAGIYPARPDIRAVLHAHPPYATAFSATSAAIRTDLVAETRALLGTPAVAPYSIMGGRELARYAAEAVRSSNAVLLMNHGALTVGASLPEAFVRMEALETAARTTLMTRLIGSERPLSAGDIAEIDRLFGQA